MTLQAHTDAARLWKALAKRLRGDNLHTSRVLKATHKELATYRDHHARSTEALAKMQVELDGWRERAQKLESAINDELRKYDLDDRDTFDELYDLIQAVEMDK